MCAPLGLKKDLLHPGSLEELGECNFWPQAQVAVTGLSEDLFVSYCRLVPV